MKLDRFFAPLFLMLSSSIVMAADGLIAKKSTSAAKVTMDRFEAIAIKQGLTIFARIDHAVGAAKVGKILRPTEVLIFGDPKGGTPFMECAQSVGIDLPLKVLVWEDAQGQVWLGYNDPAYIAKRHGVEKCPIVSGLSKVLTELTAKATAN